MARPKIIREAILSLVESLAVLVAPTRDRPLTTDEFRLVQMALLVLKGWGEDIK